MGRRSAQPMGVAIDDVRAISATLPRSYEALVRGQLKFRVGRIVYAAFYEDGSIMGWRDNPLTPSNARFTVARYEG